jgi:hypothetical protein
MSNSAKNNASGNAAASASTATDTTATAGNNATVITKPAKAKKEAAPKAPKEPSKVSKAKVIFSEQLAKRTAGEFKSNKDFRQSVIRRLESELSVSTASAATMYNTAKVEAEQKDPNVGLGRDPKVEKPAKDPNAKPGRPKKAAATEAAPALNTAAVDAQPSQVEAAPAGEAQPA